MRRWEQQGGDNGRDEQRRRQNEYHAALAEQVRLQEAKKLAERHDRLASQHQQHHRGGGGSDNGPQVQGGLFAGLGQNHTVGKNTYARGHHVEKMTAELKKQGQPPPQELPNAPGEPSQPPYAAYNAGHGGPSPAHYNEPPRMSPPHEQHQYDQPPQYPTPQQPGGYPEYHQGAPSDTNSPYYHQPPQQSFPQQGCHPGGYDQPRQVQGQYPPNQPFLPMPPPPHGTANHPSPPPPSQLQHQQPPSTSHGRRHQVSTTSSGDPSRRNAQMEAQSFLKQQMEDNQRRKAEAKRKKDEEERAEMQRIEKELKLQAEAFEAEKRAKVKEAAAKQQQLENDLRLKQEEELKKTNPKLRHKNMHDDAAPVAQATNQPPPPIFPPEGHSHALPPFGTPREPQGFDHHPVQQFSPRDNQPPWQHQQFQPMTQPMPPPHNPMDQGYSTMPPPYQPHPGGFPGDAFAAQMFPPTMPHAPSMAMIPPMQMQPSPSMTHFMDARLQMLANELASQRALVEQLVHQTPASGRGIGLTAGDFDKLRREMQDELDRRDAMHKQELEALKAQAAGGIARTHSTRLLPLNDNHGAIPAQDRSPQKPFPGDKWPHPNENARTSLPPVQASLEGGQEAEDISFVSNSPHKPFPGANGQYNIQGSAKKDGQRVASSPHKPFPGASGHYNMPGQPVDNSAANAPADNTFESTSPHKAFPGVNGQYNLHGAAARQERQVPANPPHKSIPARKGQLKSQTARRSKSTSAESSREDDSTFVSDSPQKPFPGANGQYKLQGTAQTQRSRPPANASIESNQDEERPFMSTSVQKPFPGANGQYNIQGGATTGEPSRGAQQPSSRSPDAKAYPGGNGLHTLTHQRSPRRRQVLDAESPQKPSRTSRIPGQPRRVSHQPSPPKSTRRSERGSDAASSPTRMPHELRPSQPHRSASEQEKTSPFAVVNLLEGSLDGSASHFVASNNDNVTLKCESTMIYFDGHVDAHQVPAIQPNQVDGSDASDISALSPRFSALFAGKDPLSSSLHAQDNQLDQSLSAAPSIPGAVVTTHPEPSFQVHEVAPPASWQCLRYGCDESLSLNGCDGSFDIDALYEKNTTRRNLLEQLEQRSASAPQHVEDLVATFRAISSQKSTRPTAQDEVQATSKWVGDSTPKWLPRRI